MADPSGTLAVAWQWQRRWSIAADKAKKTLRRWRLSALVLVLAGAVAGVGSGWFGDDGWWAAVVAVLTIGLSPWVAAQAGTSRVEDAARLRAISEELKAEIFGCLARARPYERDDRLAVLDERLEVLMTGHSRLHLLVSAVPIPGKPRSLPAVTNAQSYVDVRLGGQLKYYRGASFEQGRKAGRYRIAQYVLAAVAGVFAAAAAVPVTHWASAWIGVFTTAATAVATHAAAAHFESHTMAYDRTADELEALRARWHEGRAGDVVLECERVLATQNKAWFAQWTTEGKAGAP
ncbi:DUF4231 domain-containing protein [Amycolatopsis thailandensis]|uniref:DUF4231 domain-containing protein n=1 Tax=Amycolatopsis thailandensis TaxID=589330 RepID=UPI0036520CB9